MRGRRLYLLAWSILMTTIPLVAQKNEIKVYDSLLTDWVKLEDPVFKPVVGVAWGSFSFLGDINDENWRLFSNHPGPRITFSRYLDKKHYYIMDFYMMMGSLSGSRNTPKDHLNFKTDISVYGITVQYDISHYYRKPTNVTPYFAIGLEVFNFSSKGDLKDADGEPYLYGSDGTIRDPQGKIVTRDYIYESDLRSLDLYGKGNYYEYGFAFPLEVGFKMSFSERLSLRLGSSIHYTTSDMIDNVDEHSVGVRKNKRNDMFLYTFLSLHLDLFTYPRYKKVKKVFAELPADDVLSGDEDHDWVLDLRDECPHTPAGVEVDTLGCPLDSDKDGVPDYLDKEPHSKRNAVVDDEGRQIADTTGAYLLSKKGAPVGDVGYYLQAGGSSSVHRGERIPLRFRQVDTNDDGEISFDELLKTIDDYFDYRTLLSMEDIYDLLNFYFSQ